MQHGKIWNVKKTHFYYKHGQRLIYTGGAGLAGVLDYLLWQFFVNKHICIFKKMLGSSGGGAQSECKWRIQIRMSVIQCGSWYSNFVARITPRVKKLFVFTIGNPQKCPDLYIYDLTGFRSRSGSLWTASKCWVFF